MPNRKGMTKKKLVVQKQKGKTEQKKMNRKN
jgi:hypothetical protein